MKLKSVIRGGAIAALFVLFGLQVNAQQKTSVSLSDENKGTTTYTLEFSEMDMAGTVYQLEQLATQSNWELSSYDLDKKTAVINTNGSSITGTEVATKVSRSLNGETDPALKKE